MPDGDLVTAPALSESLTRAVSWLAVGVAMVIALAPPLGYFTLRYTNEAASTKLEAEMIAGQVTGLIAGDPVLWAMRYPRLMELMTPSALDATPPEVRGLTGVTDGLIIEVRLPHGAVPDGPLLSTRARVFDQGHVVGYVKIERTMWPIVSASVHVGLISVAAALCGFAGLRALPLRLLRRALERAAWLASHDPLTGLPNRALFGERLTAALATARRDGTSVAVLCLDLDHFKEVNDTLGHAAGDRLLGEVVKRLAGGLRETDTLSRMGGDEFTVVQTLVKQPDAAGHLAGRLLGLIAEPFDLDGHQVVIGTSIGIALSDAGASGPSRLLKEADLALYQAKAAGRSAFRFFETAMNERLLARKALEADLRQALAAGDFQMHYQPQVSLNGGGNPRVVGAEALIRWTHARRGVMSPGQFIPLAEETGLIMPIGEWALTEACQSAVTWPPDISIAVNVSAVQFRHPDFLVMVRRVLADTGLDGRRLELEVTEGLLMSETDETVATMTRLREMGVRLAMDDFGTGYSSLGYLRKFRFDKIKIDKSFVSNLGNDAEAGAIVRAVVGISHALGMRANAEGVETEEQAAMLRAEGCCEVQGYLYGSAMPAEVFAAMAADRDRSERPAAAA